MFFCENECVVCAKIESAITDFCRLVCFYGGIGGNNKRPKNGISPFVAKRCHLKNLKRLQNLRKGLFRFPGTVWPVGRKTCVSKTHGLLWNILAHVYPEGGRKRTRIWNIGTCLEHSWGNNILSHLRQSLTRVEDKKVKVLRL